MKYFIQEINYHVILGKVKFVFQNVSKSFYMAVVKYSQMYNCVKFNYISLTFLYRDDVFAYLCSKVFVAFMKFGLFYIRF